MIPIKVFTVMWKVSQKKPEVSVFGYYLTV